MYFVTQNLTLNSGLPITLSRKEKSIPKVLLEEERPLILLLEYMNARKKRIKEIVDIYLNWGFDVLQIHLKPLQLLFPASGSQVVAKDLANFLAFNDSYKTIIVHGFSVGSYLWGETLVRFEKDLNLYQPIFDRIKGQILDSPADLEALPTAFSFAVFPKNSLLRLTFQKYLSCHLKIYRDTVTKHYCKARKALTSGLIKAPTLFITSNADIFVPFSFIEKARDEILGKNLVCYVKCFQESQHVLHFNKYTDEYVKEMRAFLNRIGQTVQLKSKL